MIKYRSSEEKDLDLCTKILIGGFYPQLKIFFGHPIPFNLLYDILKSFMKLENNGFIVAEDNNIISGFILISRSMQKLILRFIQYHFGRILLKFIKGGYIKVSIKSILFLIIQFIYFNLQSINHISFSQGQILILSVDSRFRRKGIGKTLLTAGMKYVKTFAKSVKLEVRQDNIPAITLYLKEGFVVKGKVKSSIGFSLVLIKNF
ncbi:MAG: GNAT family N-acetyltransferase [Candidatus Omnitrophica bacterium]|nr:GNAT family N-acetyltransferase [Candidatus Omnitrophota bacterium]